MPKLGEILYNKLKNELLPTEKKIGKTLYTDNDKKFLDKTKELQESWKAMALFFQEIKYVSSASNYEIFDNAYKFCYDMAGAVKYSREIADDTAADRATRVYEDIKSYRDFDKALERLFPDSGKNSSSISIYLANVYKKYEQEYENAVTRPKQPINPSAPEQINYEHDLYNYKRTEALMTTNAGKNLIKGLRGLQNYIKDGNSIDNELAEDLNNKIKNVDKKITPYQQNLDVQRESYLKYLKVNLDNSHRLLGNSPEYGRMLNSARNLYNNWKEKDADERGELVDAAFYATEDYISRKRGSHNENDWTPITKEEKKLFALANNLLKTVEDLLDEDLTNPDKKDLIEDDENENDIEKLAKIKLNDYSDEYDIAFEEDVKYDVLAKAVAVNVLMQMGKNGICGSESTPEQIFSKNIIDQLAAEVKQTQWFKNNKDGLKQKVFRKVNGVVTSMEKKDFSELGFDMVALNINLGDPKLESAKITSTQPEQDNVKDIDDMNTNSNDNKSIGKKL